MINLMGFIDTARNRTDGVQDDRFFFVGQCCEEKSAWFKKACKIILVGMIYALLIIHTGFSVPCPFRYFTGYLCPGCGITTLFLSLACADFKSAEKANAFLFYTLPLLFLFVIMETFCPKSKIACLSRKYLIPAYLIALIVFGFYRNMGT